MTMNRRAFLTSTAFVGAAAVTGCTTAQITSLQAGWASVVGQIQQAVANAAAYIPTIESIAATAASLFGPQYSALVQVGTAAFNQIVATLVNVVASLTPPAAARLAVKLSASSPQTPVIIGTTSTGIRVTGWRS